jgi:hypothetical protein
MQGECYLRTRAADRVDQSYREPRFMQVDLVNFLSKSLRELLCCRSVMSDDFKVIMLCFCSLQDLLMAIPFLLKFSGKQFLRVHILGQ